MTATWSTRASRSPRWTGERWLSVIHPDDRERTMTRWMADVASGSEHDIEWRLRAADGRYRWFKARGLPVRDESGQVVKWVGTFTDIDDQKRRRGGAAARPRRRRRRPTGPRTSSWPTSATRSARP